MVKLSKIAMLFSIVIFVFSLAACILPDTEQNPTGNTEIGPHDHIFTEIIIKEATCTEDGQKDLVCDICGYTEGHTICGGHQLTRIDDKEPNCTETGWENYDKCEVCKQDFYTELEINPNLHDFDEAGICTRCNKNAYEGINFCLSDDKKYYIVVGVENPQINEIRIPSHYEGLEVTTIGAYAFQECFADRIVLPDTITVIKSGAFSGCIHLTELVIPEGVTEIGNETFRGCSSLKSITIGKGVKELGRFAFEKCSALKDFIVDEENPYLKAEGGALYSNDGTVLYVYGPGNTATSFTVPEGVKIIAETAFAYNETLTSVTLPEGLTHIADYAFSCCKNLSSINLPDTLLYIGDDALKGTALTTVVIPDSVTYLGGWNFYDSQYLTSLTIGSGVTRIGGQVVGCCENLTELIFKDPNGWYVAMKNKVFAADELNNSFSAITFLRDTYYENDWRKVTEE